MNKRNYFADRCHSLTYQNYMGKWIVNGIGDKYGFGMEESVYLDCLQSEEEVKRLYPSAIIHPVYPVLNPR
jgi:hypothetical protein